MSDERQEKLQQMAEKLVRERKVDWDERTQFMLRDEYVKLEGVPAEEVRPDVWGIAIFVDQKGGTVFRHAVAYDSWDPDSSFKLEVRMAGHGMEALLELIEEVVV